MPRNPNALVGFVKDNVFHRRERHLHLDGKVEQTARSGDDNVGVAVNARELFVHAGKRRRGRAVRKPLGVQVQSGTPRQRPTAAAAALLVTADNKEGAQIRVFAKFLVNEKGRAASARRAQKQERRLPAQRVPAHLGKAVRLQRQLTRRREDERARANLGDSRAGGMKRAVRRTNVVLLPLPSRTPHLCRVDLEVLEHGDEKGGRLSGTGARHCNNVLASHDERDGAALDGRRQLVPLARHAGEDVAGEAWAASVEWRAKRKGHEERDCDKRRT